MSPTVSSCDSDKKLTIPTAPINNNHENSNQRIFHKEGKNTSTNMTNTLAPQLSMLYGSISKIIASLSTYPYQVVKSRLQQGDVLQPRIAINNSTITNNLSSNTKNTTNTNTNASTSILSTRDIPKYTGTIDCIRKIWKFEGFLGFFRGAVPSSLRSAPSAGITLLVYEETLRLLRNNDSLRY